MKCCSKLRNLLRIFHKETSSGSASQFVSISMKWRIFEFLSDSVDDFEEVEEGQLNEIALDTQQKLANYVSQVNCEISRLWRILYPRFANTNAEDRNYIRTIINSLVIEQECTGNSTNMQEENFFKSIFGKENPNYFGWDEVKLFLQAAIIMERASTDPLVWRKMSESRFPAISKLAHYLFSAQASSVVSRWPFSVAGRLIDSNRSRLSDESIQAVMFLQSWNKFFRKQSQ